VIYPQTVSQLGQNKIHWISYLDVSAVVAACVDNAAARNKTIQVGGGEPLSPLEVLRRLGACANRRRGQARRRAGDRHRRGHAAGDAPAPVAAAPRASRRVTRPDGVCRGGSLFAGTGTPTLEKSGRLRRPPEDKADLHMGPLLATCGPNTALVQGVGYCVQAALASGLVSSAPLPVLTTTQLARREADPVWIRGVPGAAADGSRACTARRQTSAPASRVACLRPCLRCRYGRPPDPAALSRGSPFSSSGFPAEGCHRLGQRKTRKLIFPAAESPEHTPDRSGGRASNQSNALSSRRLSGARRPR
jgi:hypothetical protein